MLTCELAPLLAALKGAKRVVPTRTVIPVLGMALIENGHLTATDLDMQLVLPVGQIGSAPPILVPVHDLLKLLSGVKGAPLVTITPATEMVARMTAGDLAADLDTLPVADFPIVWNTPDVTGTATFADEQAHKMFSAAAASVSTEETRYYRQGVCVLPERGKLTIVSTDGHRMTHLVTPQPWDAAPAILPPLAVNTALALGLKGDVTLRIRATRAEIAAPGFLLRTKLIDGTFPDYTRIIPRDVPHVSGMSVPALKDAAARMGKFCAGVLLSHEGQALFGRYDGNKRLSIGLPMTDEGGGGAARAGYTPAYLVDIANQIALFDSRLTLHNNDEGSPALIRPATQPDYATAQFVLMPRRVGNPDEGEG